MSARAVGEGPTISPRSDGRPKTTFGHVEGYQWAGAEFESIRRWKGRENISPHPNSWSACQERRPSISSRHLGSTDMDDPMRTTAQLLSDGVSPAVVGFEQAALRHALD